MHSLKGAAGTLGLTAIANTAERIEACLRDALALQQRADEILALSGTLGAQCTGMMEALQRVNPTKT